MKKYGYLKIGTIVNKIQLGNPFENVKELIKNIKKLDKEEVAIVATSASSITSLTCGYILTNKDMLNKTKEALKLFLDKTKDLKIVSIIVVPLIIKNNLTNCCLVIKKGKILGIIPENNNIKLTEIELFGDNISVSNNILFRDNEITFTVELKNILKDNTNNNATINFIMDPTNEEVGNYEAKKTILKAKSITNNNIIVYTTASINESTTDYLYPSSSFIIEEGELLTENERFSFETTINITDIDYEKVNNHNLNKKLDNDYYEINLSLNDSLNTTRVESKYPYIKSSDSNFFEELLNIETFALVRRIKYLNNSKCIIGISGGLDSTLALLIAVRAYNYLKLDLKNIIGITIPSYGTSNKTFENAKRLMKITNITTKEIDITNACEVHKKDIGLKDDDYKVAFENMQARERTQILMDIANIEKGFVLGTGDLSELALGWCTYNGDHMSMYSPNATLPKTLIQKIVTYLAEHAEKELKEVLLDIVATPISPELLPTTKKKEINQKTENIIGPYILHDYFLYHFLVNNYSLEKIYFISTITFKNNYRKEEILKWLKIFINRFIKQQFKRNCMPDGVKITNISLSPRGEYNFPSDINPTIYNDILEKLELEINKKR